MTQKEWVLRQLKAGRKITALDAMQEHGVGRLAARIKDLRWQGHDIDSEMVEVTKADGSTARVAQYSMDIDQTELPL